MIKDWYHANLKKKNKLENNSKYNRFWAYIFRTMKSLQATAGKYEIITKKREKKGCLYSIHVDWPTR